MPIYRGDGGSGESNTNVYASDIAEDANTATTKATEAANSAASAANSAATALNHKNDAEDAKDLAETAKADADASKTAAYQSELSAAASETNAGNSETAAAAAQTAAETAQTAAEDAQTAAETAETNAETAETNAGNSATAAASSATAAASSATTAAGSATTAASEASDSATSATAASGSATAAASSATSAATSATNAATSESNASTSESNASTSETNAATAATNAATSESNAATSASNAATSATNAATSESNAATSESNASSSATAAASSATSAASSATSASTSATNAAASYDSFDDRYLGAKTSDPSTDNDGDTLLVGALYYNNTSGTMKIWTGTVWEAAYVSADGYMPLSGATMTGALTLSGDPSTGLQAATKQYVDTIAAASLHYHDPVRVEKEGNLSATYDNGSSGVGATLTNNSTQEALVIDGVSLALNDRVLIYEQTDATQNGIYTVTTVGDGSTNWVLTRATDADSYGPSDPDSFGEGDAFYVTEGTAGAGELYVMNTSGTITFGTTNITFAQISSAQVYTAGTGISISGSEISSDITLQEVTDSGASTTATVTAGGFSTSGNIAATGTVSGSNINSNNWDTAYGWGNHASAGYLTSYTETDPVYTASSWYTTTNNSSNWNTAYGWGNHASANYLLTTSGNDHAANAWGLRLETTGYNNPSGFYAVGNNFTMIVRNSAGGIGARLDADATEANNHIGGNPIWHKGNLTTTEKSNWNTAYGWGNHASAGYQLASTAIETTDDLRDLNYMHLSHTNSNSDYNTTDEAWFLSNNTNGPNTGHYYHTQQWFWSSKSGSSNRAQLAIQYNGGADMYVRSIYSGTWSGWYKVWTSGNDGSGSGLDADTVDGLDVHTGRNHDANKIVRTDSSGYIQAGWINSTSGSATTSTITRITASYDNYLRYYTPDNFVNTLPASVSSPNVCTAENLGMVNYIYNTGGTTLTRGVHGTHIWHNWSTNPTITLTSSTWQKGDTIEFVNVRGYTLTVNATRIYLPSGSYDTSVFINQPGRFRLIKYTSSTGYWMLG